MTDKRIILIGGGGHCRSAIDVIEADGSFKIAGIVDLPEKVGEQVLGYFILADESALPALVKEHRHFVVTVGHIRDCRTRRRLFELVKMEGGVLPVICSPTARVSPHARIGDGTVVFHQAVVNSLAEIGENCIINTGAVIEHDAVIEDHVHVSTGAVVNGACRVRSGSFIGSQAVLAEGVTVGRGNLIGAGAVVLKDTDPESLWAGNPARRIKTHHPGRNDD